MVHGTATSPPPRPAEEPAIEVLDVHLAFGAKQVLKGVNLLVGRGETITLLGESGSGKTVLLKVILGLLTPDRGRVRLLGTDIVGASDEVLLPVRARCGVVYQQGALYSGMTVAENIALALKEVLHLRKADVDERIRESLEAVGLGGTDPSTNPAELSGGMKKRLAVARAVAPRPEVLFYDEPTSGLDPLNSARILGLIQSLRDRLGVTSIVVTHDVLGACGISDRIVLLSDGILVFDGTPSEFLASTVPVVRTFRESAPGVSKTPPVAAS